MRKAVVPGRRGDRLRRRQPEHLDAIAAADRSWRPARQPSATRAGPGPVVCRRPRSAYGWRAPGSSATVDPQALGTWRTSSAGRGARRTTALRLLRRRRRRPRADDRPRGTAARRRARARRADRAGVQPPARARGDPRRGRRGGRRGDAACCARSAVTANAAWSAAGMASDHAPRARRQGVGRGGDRERTAGDLVVAGALDRRRRLDLTVVTPQVPGVVDGRTQRSGQSATPATVGQERPRCAASRRDRYLARVSRIALGDTNPCAAPSRSPCSA